MVCSYQRSKMRYSSICLVLITIGSAIAYEDFFDKSTTLLYFLWKLSDAVNCFAFDVHAELTMVTEDNLIFSPISITNTLAMLHFGARGRTARQLEYVLGYEYANVTRSMAARAYRHLLTTHMVTTKPRMYLFEMANMIFINNHLSISPAYKRRVEEFYRSPIRVVNFVRDGDKAVVEVNEWVKNKTRNKIKSIVDELDPSVDVVIVNAAYFKGQWRSPFRTDNTKERTFYNGGEKARSIPMMEQENVFFHGRDHEVSLLELPFKGNNLSMVFILPHKMDGLIQLEQNITQERMFRFLELMSLKRVLVTVPKFKISFSTELAPIIQSLGATQLFQPTHANLTGMVQNEHVAIGEIKHKAIIDVKESGVEASAATATMSFKSVSTPERDVEFRADHPFMFVILDKRTSMFLFMGRVWSL